jgi:hypothetical protein
MKITKRQLRRIIKETKRKIIREVDVEPNNWDVDEPLELDRRGIMTAAGLIELLQRLPSEATIWVGRSSEYRSMSLRDLRIADDVVQDADDGEEYKTGPAAFIETWG